jgi:hypothetical protein
MRSSNLQLCETKDLCRSKSQQRSYKIFSRRLRKLEKRMIKDCKDSLRLSRLNMDDFSHQTLRLLDRFQSSKAIRVRCVTKLAL